MRHGVFLDVAIRGLRQNCVTFWYNLVSKAVVLKTCWFIGLQLCTPIYYVRNLNGKVWFFRGIESSFYDREKKVRSG